MQLANLTEQESKNVNIVAFVIMIIVVVIFGILLFYKYFASNNNKMIANLVKILSGIYLVLIVATSIIYFVYRNSREKVSSDNSDIVIKPVATIAIGILVVALVMYLLKHIEKGGSANLASKYFALSSTSEGLF